MQQTFGTFSHGESIVLTLTKYFAMTVRSVFFFFSFVEDGSVYIIATNLNNLEAERSVSYIFFKAPSFNLMPLFIFR